MYDAAWRKADQGENETAMRMTEEGLRRGQTDAVCVCKFRTLQARLALARNPAETMNLVTRPCPAQLDATEFPAWRAYLLGQAYTSLGRRPEAEKSLADAERLAAFQAPELRAKVAVAWGNFAAKGEGGDDDDALVRAMMGYYTRAVELARQNGSQDDELTALTDLGYTLNRQERFSEAIDRFLAVLDLARKLPQTRHIAVVRNTALGNLGWSYLELGNFDQAVASLQQAEGAAASLGLKQHQQSWDQLLGNAHLDQGEYTQADRHYHVALQLAQDMGDTGAIALTYHNLAQLELARNNPAAAERYNRQAYAAKGLKPDDQSDALLMITTAEIAKARGQFPEAENTLKSILRLLGAPVPNKDGKEGVGKKDDSNTSLRWRARSDLAGVYVAEGKYDDAEREYEKALKIVEDTSKKVKLEERRMSILDAWPFYDDYIRFLVDRNKPEKALQTAEFSRARTLAEAFGIKTQQMASSLQLSKVQVFLAAHRQVILAYWLSDKESYLWAITPDKFRLFHLPGRSEIEKAVVDNGRHISDHMEVAESEAARRLYNLLVKPAEALIPENARVTIVPNRSLYKLNFETLIVPGARPHYWIEDAQLDNESSIALLISSKRRALKPTKGMLLVGAPLEVNKQQFPVLKHAEDEVRIVGSHYTANEKRQISGAAATPLAYRMSQAGQYRYIDFVSHGAASATSPLDSAIILSSDADGSYKLYAREIKDIPLHADLVTISACYSAGAKTYASEGLVGLAWAFMRAGAHQVIAGLWEVDDAASPQFMDDFYTGLSHGKSAAEALREAKLSMLHRHDFYRYPYYWASLQLYAGS